MTLVKHHDVKSKIISIRNQNVILDSDVAELYGVQTKEINQAVKRNPEKFPKGYILDLTPTESEPMRSQIVTASTRNITHTPKAFTERGLYMLATILRSPQAINTTLAIIDTFTQFKDVTQAIYEMAEAHSDAQKIEIFERSTDIVADLLDNELIVSQQETGFTLKLPFFEVTRKVTKVQNKTGSNVPKN